MTSSRQWLLVACLLIVTLLSRPLVAAGDSVPTPGLSSVPDLVPQSAITLSEVIGKQDGGGGVNGSEQNDPNDGGGNASPQDEIPADDGRQPPDGGGGDSPAPAPDETTPSPIEAPPETEPPTEAPPPETEPPTPNEVTPEPTSTPQETESPAAAPPPDTPSPTSVEGTPEPTRVPQETEAPTRAEPEKTPAPTTAEPVETPAPTTEDTTLDETTEPTVQPSAPPSKPPVTASPSSSPTISTTDAPSTAPSPMPDPSIMIEDMVSVIIKPVSGVMSAGNAEHFQATATVFLSELLIQLEQPIYDVNVSVTGGNILARQRRLQSDSMQVDMIVSGTFDPVPGLAETANDYSIGRVSRQFFTVQGDNFVRMLQETNNDEDASYFAPVSVVESVADPNDEVTPAGSPPPPGTATVSGDEPGLAIGGIVAVALVGALAVALGAAFLVSNVRKRRRNNPAARSRREKKASSKSKSGKITSKKSGSSKGSSARQKPSSTTASLEKALEDKPPPILSIGGPPSERGSMRRVDSDVNSDLQWGAESFIGAESNMSYAYSLEDGIQRSPSGESSLGYSLGLDNDSAHADSKDKSSVPKEIPNVSSSASKNDDDDDLDVDKSWTPNPSSIFREITAPAGKLGVVLNTSEKGPVVQSVAAGSPLEGMVWPGDVVISIDGMKTSKMSAASVTEYMSKNLFKPRNLTVMSDPDA